jgi:small subunit ribosomal protein S21
MIVVPVKEGESIEKALKKFKKKFERTGVVKEIRRRQAYKKPSVEQREEKIKAVYKQGLIVEELQA